MKKPITKICSITHEEAIAAIRAHHPFALWYTSIPGKMCHQFRGVPGSSTRGWDYLVSCQDGTTRFAPHNAIDYSSLTADGITIERFRSVFSLVIVKGGPKHNTWNPLIKAYCEKAGIPLHPLTRFLEKKPRWVHVVGTIPMPNLPQTKR